MQNNIMFAAGLGSTGSSALVDLLKEVDGFYSMDDEFRLFVDPGGLVTLRDALVENWTVFQSDVAIREFKRMIWSLSRKKRSPYTALDHRKYFDKEFEKCADDFISKLTDLEFRGFWYGIDNIWMRQLNKIVGLPRTRFNSKKMYLGKNVSENEFNQCASEFIQSLVEYVLRKESRSYFCFNENLSCMMPSKVLGMVPGSKMILVIRDPKDVYADSLRVKWPAIPQDPSEYIKWQIAVYQGWMNVESSQVRSSELSTSLMVVRFEDLVINYNETVDLIFDFLEIDKSQHTSKGQYFNPSRSIKNIGQWKDVLSKDVVDLFDAELDFFYSYYKYKDLSLRG